MAELLRQIDVGDHVEQAAFRGESDLFKVAAVDLLERHSLEVRQISGCIDQPPVDGMNTTEHEVEIVTGENFPETVLGSRDPVRLDRDTDVDPPAVLALNQFHRVVMIGVLLFPHGQRRIPVPRIFVVEEEMIGQRDLIDPPVEGDLDVRRKRPRGVSAQIRVGVIVRDHRRS